MGSSAPVYVENVVAIRRNVQSLAATFLMLSAPVPSGVFINVPLVSVTTTPQAPAVLDTSTPMLMLSPPVYTEAPTTFLRNNWLARKWLLSTQQTLGTVINVPTVPVAITPYPPTPYNILMFLYLPSDDGWWPEPDIPKANPNRNLLLLGASTTAGNVSIPLPSVSVTVTPYAPNPVASGGSVTINLPAPPAVSLTPYPPTVTQNNTITFQVPVAQVQIVPEPIATPLGVIPTAVVTIGVFPPAVINSGVTIWDATFKCVNAGLIIGQDQWITNPTVPYGYVISQSPASGTVVPLWTVVNFVVSFGPGATVQTLSVPNVVGLEAYQAEQQCTALGMDINPRAYAYSATVARDYVIAQSVAAGLVVNTSTPISMTVSIGTAPTSPTVTVP